MATLIVNIVETFNGIRAVQAFRREKRNDAIFAGLNGDYREANREAFRLHVDLHPGHHADRQRRPTVAVLLVGGYRVANGELELGVLTSFLLYLRQFYDPMEDVAVFYNSLQSATAALEKIAAAAGRGAVGARAGRSGRAARRRGWARCDLDGVEFGYRADRPGAARAVAWTSRPGRPSRSSARPVRARRRSPS